MLQRHLQLCTCNRCQQITPNFMQQFLDNFCQDLALKGAFYSGGTSNRLEMIDRL